MSDERDERIFSNTERWVPDESEHGGRLERMTWRQLCEQQEQQLLSLEAHRRMLSDLDRNEGGRHQGDVDGGDPTGWSQGNPHLETGQVLGYSIAGKHRPYVVPPPGKRGDVRAWRQGWSDWND